jgi:hypothetical protein
MRRSIATQFSDHPHVDGVVISSASAWPLGTIEPDAQQDGQDGYALRCSILPIMARETLIVPLNTGEGTKRHARMWRDLYASEPNWLDHALERFALPPCAEIFAVTTEP